MERRAEFSRPRRRKCGGVAAVVLGLTLAATAVPTSVAGAQIQFPPFLELRVPKPPTVAMSERRGISRVRGARHELRTGANHVEEARGDDCVRRSPRAALAQRLGTDSRGDSARDGSGRWTGAAQGQRRHASGGVRVGSARGGWPPASIQHRLTIERARPIACARRRSTPPRYP